MQELPAIEGLARVDVVCTDKTGTLTNNSMELKEVTPLGEAAEDETLAQAAQQALAAMAIYDDHPNDSMKAIAEWATSGHDDAYAGEQDWEQTAVVPFSSDKKWSAMGFGKHGEWMRGAGIGAKQPRILLPPLPQMRSGRLACVCCCWHGRTLRWTSWRTLRPRSLWKREL